MKLSEFQDAVDRYGVQLATWPLAIRSEALALLSTEPAARDLLTEAEALARTIRAVDPVRAPRDFAARIVTAAMEADKDSAASQQPVSPPIAI